MMHLWQFLRIAFLGTGAVQVTIFLVIFFERLRFQREEYLRHGEFKRRNWSTAFVVLSYSTLFGLSLFHLWKYYTINKDLGSGHSLEKLVMLASITVTSLTSIFVATGLSDDFWRTSYFLVSTINWVLFCHFTIINHEEPSDLLAAYFLGLLATLGIPYNKATQHEDLHPFTQISLLPSISLSWLDPLLKRATSSVISVEDLWHVDDGLSVRNVLGEVGTPASGMPSFGNGLSLSLPAWLFYNFPRILLQSALFGTLNLAATFAQPFALQALLERRDTMFVAGLFGATFLAGVSEAHMRYLLRQVGLKVRSGLTARIGDQILRVIQDPGQGQVPEPAVLIETDLPNIFAMIELLHALWMIPFQVIISLCALVYILGWQSIAVGCLGIVILLPCLSYTLKLISIRMQQVMQAKDARVSLVLQVLKQIKQIKLEGSYLRFYEDKISETRNNELTKFGYVAFSNAAMMFVVTILPPSITCLAFGTRAILGQELNSVIVFPALTFLFSIQRAASMLPRIFMNYQAGWISFTRIRQFLLSAPSSTAQGGEFRHHHITTIESPIIMESCTVGFFQAEQKLNPLIRNCNIIFGPRSLNVIAGAVGSGKSTLLRTLIGATKPLAGSLNINGSIAFVSQVPFIINGTIRENITFGLSLDLPYYERVLDATLLRDDFRRLPGGDLTVLGGTGIALSGGQKSRICLARAIYSRRDIMILDDPLAAIDTKVSRELVDRVLGPNGILKNTTRVITTSSEAFLQMADTAHFIDNGCLTQVPLGPSKPLQQKGKAVIQLSHSEVEESFTTSVHSGYGTVAGVKRRRVNVGAEEVVGEGDCLLHQQKDFSLEPVDAPVKWQTYAYFMALAKRGGWVIVLTLASAAKILDIASVYFLKLAVDENKHKAGEGFELIYYIILGSLGAFFTAAFVAAAYNLCLIPASRSVHAALTKGILESKIRFFDEVPLGEIVNRFTNDMHKVDTAASGGLISLAALGVSISGSILVIFLASYLSLAYLIPVTIMYFSVQSLYVPACRQLRRLENLTRGPILNLTNETARGVETIQCFDQCRLFRGRMRDLIDSHLRVWAPFLALDIWLSLRLQVLSSFLQLFSAGLLLKLGVSSSTLGLVLNYVIQITAQLNIFVQMRANLEADMISVERISAYASNPPESSSSIDASPGSDWPLKPSVVFKSFTMSYVPKGKPCLEKIEIKIAPGEHVAVVGRTGAGKSSMALALLKGTEREAVQGGKILIGNQDISELNPVELRKRITWLPQEPIAFEGTLLENLDPKGLADPTRIQTALDVCHAHEIFKVGDHQSLLNLKIGALGTNLSGGQIQILALAKALLSRNKIVILDEATAAADARASKVMHQVIHTHFRESTVIMITHNIDSAFECDKVLVLDLGRVVGYGSPQDLIQQENSAFSTLVEESKANNK